MCSVLFFPLNAPCATCLGGGGGQDREGGAEARSCPPCTFPIALREQIAEGRPGQNGLCNFANVPESLKSLLPSLQTLPLAGAAAPLSVAFQDWERGERRVPRPSSGLYWRKVCSPPLALLGGTKIPVLCPPPWLKTSLCFT